VRALTRYRPKIALNIIGTDRRLLLPLYREPWRRAIAGFTRRGYCASSATFFKQREETRDHHHARCKGRCQRSRRWGVLQPTFSEMSAGAQRSDSGHGPHGKAERTTTLSEMLRRSRNPAGDMLSRSRIPSNSSTAMVAPFNQRDLRHGDFPRLSQWTALSLRQASAGSFWWARNVIAETARSVLTTARREGTSRALTIIRSMLVNTSTRILGMCSDRDEELAISPARLSNLAPGVGSQRLGAQGRRVAVVVLINADHGSSNIRTRNVFRAGRRHWKGRTVTSLDAPRRSYALDDFVSRCARHSATWAHYRGHCATLRQRTGAHDGRYLDES